MYLFHKYPDNKMQVYINFRTIGAFSVRNTHGTTYEINLGTSQLVLYLQESDKNILVDAYNKCNIK
jgi:hypothetical protein